ncbi:MAG: phosphoribosylanthranilate isomerase [Acidibacillus sp.]|uniref:N-(5'-phosphoribosyl)anthranilate isomerase n=1 Tax=Sulfoacidibacillus ferrooxidans TaxID=2005001 RepID=A0A9X1VBA1_9BACL|nr:phosphoribosylanthranilate isomerase [Sulfoacidibacillus ferrooxidans]MCI0184294.1 N-(5'-phosphoribosyl)anthranilate isomerase [Sulfoacidibacillus ferrooxidans]MCY0894552.1 phosphoribosylanthranilate isomerase [Acidibacillus sp.]
MTKIKLCGLRSIEDVMVATDARADYIGFVLAKSKRQVTLQQVQYMLSLLRDQYVVVPEPVLVLVDQSEEEIATICATLGVSHVQLCGAETPEMCSRLRTQHGLTVWKAWGVRGTNEDHELARYVGNVDAILLDTYKTGTHGGTGHPFQWTAIDDVRYVVDNTPLIIAGGLQVGTVTSLISQYHPFAVDVSSGIETEMTGEKDPIKMHAFVKAARSESHVS